MARAQRGHAQRSRASSGIPYGDTLFRASLARRGCPFWPSGVSKAVALDPRILAAPPFPGIYPLGSRPVLPELGILLGSSVTSGGSARLDRLAVCRTPLPRAMDAEARRSEPWRDFIITQKEKLRCST